jgi:uncharacterized repeat protein (TIGR01451 family)
MEVGRCLIDGPVGGLLMCLPYSDNWMTEENLYLTNEENCMPRMPILASSLRHTGTTARACPVRGTLVPVWLATLLSAGVLLIVLMMSPAWNDATRTAYAACSDVVTVTSGGNDGEGTLRQALAEVCDGGAIVFDSSVDTVTLTSSQLIVNKNLTIQGPGAESLTVRRDIGADEFRLFYIARNTITVTMTDMTLTNGSTTDNGGGAILNFGTLLMRDSVLHGNESPDSATGGGRGGAILNFGFVHLANSELYDNTTDSGGRGGAIFNFETVTIEGSTLRNNQTLAGGLGGAVLNQGAMTITHSLFERNQSTIGVSPDGSRGGAIFNFGAITVTHSTLYSNTTPLDTGEGGAIYTTSGGSLKVYNSTLSNNAAWRGGAILTFSGQTHIDSSTIVSNTTTDGGIYNLSTTNLTNTIVAYHSNNDCSNPSGSVNSRGYNLDSDNTCLLIEPGDIPGTNPLLAPLADNGGPMPTHLPMARSPVIDAGHEGEQCPATDQRGVPRPQFAGCDIGAVERNPADLGISKTVTPTVVETGGETITYTLRFFNIGDITATTVILTDTLPAFVTITNVIGSGVPFTNTGSTDPLVWDVADMAPGAEGIITLTGVISTGVPDNFALINQATISGEGEGPFTDNNTDSARVTSPPRGYLPIVRRRD